MKNISSYIIAASLSFILVPSGFSQDGKLPNEEIKVVKEFDARLLESKAVKLPGIFPDSGKKIYNFDYKINPDIPAISYEAPVIRPIAATVSTPDIGYRHLIQIGAGLPKALLLDAQTNIIVSEDTELKAWAKHISMNAEPKVEHKKTALNNWGIEGTHFASENTRVDAKMEYDLNSYRWFAAADSLVRLESFEALQRFNKLGAEATLVQLLNDSSNTKFEIHGGFYRFTNNHATRENGVNLSFKASQVYDNHSVLYGELDIDASTMRDTQTQKLNNYTLSGGYNFKLNQHNFKLGAAIASNNDKYYLFPNLNINFLLNPSHSVSVNATGGLHKNNYLFLGETNPFIAPRFGQINNNKVYDFSAGINNRFSHFKLDLIAGYKTNTNLALWIPNNDNRRSFNTTYDTVNTTYLKAVFSATPTEGITIDAYFQQNFYSLTHQEKAWGLPATLAEITSHITLMDKKLLASVGLTFMGSIHQLNYNMEAEKSNSLLDFSIGGKYFISEKFGLFLDANNLINNRYRRWYNTPTFGTNIMAGIIFRI